MSSDIELNWMTSPQYLCGIKTGLTCLMELLCVLQQSWLHTVVVLCGNIILKIVVREWNVRAWTGWVPLAVRIGYGLK